MPPTMLACKTHFAPARFGGPGLFCAQNQMALRSIAMEVHREAAAKRTRRQSRKLAEPVQVTRVDQAALKLAKRLAAENGYRLRIVSATEIRLE